MQYLSKGALFDAVSKVKKTFAQHIDPYKHAETYFSTHDDQYAEPEFSGKYLAMCAFMYADRRLDVGKEHGLIVLESILAHQREDGYLGMLEPGRERNAFSIWNHGFTLYGLLSFYLATGHKDALAAAEKAGDWLLQLFSDPASPDILDAGNKGSQHISCIYPMCLLYKVTKEEKYAAFLHRLMAYVETTDMNLLSYKSIFDLRSQKGIEMLVVYLGVLFYGRLFARDKAIAAAKRYWQEIAETQIRNTGNGTIREVWTPAGNAPRRMATETKPNETCVAVGWVELSISLFLQEPKACYLDHIEQSLYNHLLGSFEKNGEDFAYYQGNFGEKIYRTSQGSYQCCRYRGFSLFAMLENYLYHWDGRLLTPMIYAPGSYRQNDIQVVCDTAYPVGQLLTYNISCQKPFTLRLRIPSFIQSSKEYTCSLDGMPLSPTVCEGFIYVEVSAGEHQVSLSLTLAFTHQVVTIDGEAYMEFHHGPLLLAADSRNGAMPDTVFTDALLHDLKCIPQADDALICYQAGSFTLVDFASAGSHAVGRDKYTVFVPYASN